MIRVESLTKRFHGPAGGPAVTALEGIELRATAGELVTVVGPSGCGKSTLLFTLGGLLHPDAGSVCVAGADLFLLDTGGRAALRRTDIGFVFQTFNLVPYLNCQDNVALAARLGGRSGADAAVAAAEMLERVGLASRAKHRPAQLSVGERQRVAVGRALVNGPKVLLADEPTGNLDPASAQGVMELFLEAAGEGKTVVVVTHDSRVAEMGDRIVEMRSGKIVGERCGARWVAAAS